MYKVEKACNRTDLQANWFHDEFFRAEQEP